MRRRVDLFDGCRGVTVWPRQQRAWAHAFIEANAIKLAMRTMRGERGRGGDERHGDQRRPHEDTQTRRLIPTLALRLLQPGAPSGRTAKARRLRVTCYERQHPRTISSLPWVLPPKCAGAVAWRLTTFTTTTCWEARTDTIAGHSATLQRRSLRHRDPPPKAAAVAAMRIIMSW